LVQCPEKGDRADKKNDGLVGGITQWSGQSLVDMVRMAEDMD